MMKQFVRLLIEYGLEFVVLVLRELRHSIIARRNSLDEIWSDDFT
jgi:hypothetical protein